MIILKNKEERELWKDAAKNAIATVETATPEEKDAKRVLAFMNVIADGAILAYRKRCGYEECHNSGSG